MARPLNIDNLVVWKLACEFEDGVVALLQRTPRAVRDFKLYSQLSDAASSVASNVAEGFYRFNASEFAHFLRYSRGSLGEAETRLRSGVRKGYWTDTAIEPWLRIAYRLGRAIQRLREYLLEAAARKKAQRTRRRPRNPPG